ncbi:MAG: T9SS type A sorting domain-containing protein [Bacteroidia bacterium]|nr:T9SS type A sorting domain-containing protein [Bacteroidia bacterium]
MKKKIFIIGTSCALSIIATSFVIKYSSGVTDKTGSPGEGSCGDCHSGGGGTTMVNVSFNPSMPSFSYVPNQTYTVTVNVMNNPFNRFGFACEILSNPSLTNVGSMANPGSGVQILTGANGRKVATHTTPKNGSGSAQFTFEWTAPASGMVTFYAIGNAVNGNGNTSGDKSSSVYTLTIGPDLTGIRTNNISGVSDVVIYPNPVKDAVQIQFNANNYLKELEFSLVDLNGQIVYEHKEKNVPAGLNVVKMILPDQIKNGLYILKTNSGKDRISKMLMIQK